MKIVFLLMSMILILNGYNFIKEEGILNGNNFIILNLENKNKLIILNKKENKIFFESDKALSYPKNNGKGYMVQSLTSLIENNYLVIQANIFSGRIYSDKYYFKLNGDKFILDKYIQEEGTSCNSWTIGNAYEFSSFTSNLYLEDFSLDYFLSNFYNKKLFYNKSKRIILKDFDIDFKNLKNAYFNKSISLKKEVFKIIAYNEEKEVNCLPKEYLNKYLYFKYPKTINKSNDIAFFFEQAGYYKEAIYLLAKIVEKYPNRTVSYINLGDSYLKDGNKEKAIKNYKIYIKQMKEKNKEEKIPKRVLEILDTSKTPIITKDK